MKNLTLADLSVQDSKEPVPIFEKPELVAKMSPFQKAMHDHGVLHLPKFIPDKIIERYVTLRERLKDDGGWNMPCPYLHFQEIRDICLNQKLSSVLLGVMGKPMGLHLNLTGWVSTERAFHQDSYLNPPHVGGMYVAVWIALDDIHPDSGPFQYFEGSHKWPVLSQTKVFEEMARDGIKPSDPLWPTKTQDWIAEICEHEAKERKARLVAYLPKKGDVLLWHRSLVHRGSKPNKPGMQRKALIAHYSSTEHRPDMPDLEMHFNPEWDASGFYFDTHLSLEGPQRV